MCKATMERIIVFEVYPHEYGYYLRVNEDVYDMPSCWSAGLCGAYAGVWGDWGDRLKRVTPLQNIPAHIIRGWLLRSEICEILAD